MDDELFTPPEDTFFDPQEPWGAAAAKGSGEGDEERQFDTCICGTYQRLRGGRLVCPQHTHSGPWAHGHCKIHLMDAVGVEPAS